MLSIAEIKPLLQHEDESIRRLALLSLSKLHHSEDGELVPLIVSSFFSLSEQTESWLLNSLRWLPITDLGFESLLFGLERFREAGRADYAYNIRDAAFAAPIEVFSKYAEQLRSALGVESGDHLARIERRLETSAWSPGDAWEELQRLCRDGSDYERPFDFRYAHDLQYALRDRQYPDGETLVSLLDSIAVEDSDRWRLEDTLVELVGHRRIREAIPVLLDKMDANPEADALLEDCPVALAQINDVEIVRQFRERYSATHANFLYYGMNALDGLWFQETEDLLIDLLSNRTSLDPELISLDVPQQIAESLCCFFSKRGIPLVAELIREEGYNYQLVEYLPFKLIAAADVVDYELPEREEWIEAIEEEERNVKRWQEENRLRASQGLRMVPYPDNDGWDDEPFEEYIPPGNYAPEPIRNTAPKVGRNDPCPCGSGKKFKKCCGKG